MPAVDLIFFKDKTGKCPVLSWLDSLSHKAEAKARVRLEELAQHGCELRRPLADYIGQGIYELRWRNGSVQYRILYFFQGQSTVVVSQGFTKKDIIPMKELNRAVENKLLFESNPEKFTYDEEE